VDHRPKKLDGLSRLADYVISTRGLRFGHRPLDRGAWLADGVSAEVVERAMAFQERWGGLVLPPAPEYDGGPVVLTAGQGAGDCFEAGVVRAAVPFTFVVGPGGEFAIEAGERVALHATVDGWVESIALTYYAAWAARRMTKVSEVDALDLDGFEPVRAVRGMADTWWRGPGRLVAIHRGQAELFRDPSLRRARVSEGVDLDGWGL
jgi:hypothetical protein